MKTPDELFEKHKTYIIDQSNFEWAVISHFDFIRALAEDRQQIKDMIDEMYQDVNYMYSDKEVLERTGYNKALTELKQWMEELK